MGKYAWQGIGFIIFIFILTLGLSSLAFNENSIEKVNNEQVMSIALVNEDEGTLFNDERVVFGDEFANSVNRDSKHEWYLVSRGVAESGYDRGSYEMVIIIPNDFSEKSLSIHLERPEPVSLQYKINATGHENVRAEAEKTAGGILNEFNKRLIDVYFASIIGNLQDAQDSISDIIDKEVEYTGAYREQIYSPLADYTNQFQTVQDYTEISKDSYRGLEDVLESFQVNLSEEVENNKGFRTELESVIRVKEEESSITKTFSDFLNQFVNKMSDSDVLTRLAILERENELVQRQFQEPQDDERTIASRASMIQTRFEQLVADMNQFEQDLEKKLHKDLKEVVKNNFKLDFVDTIEPAVDQVFTSLDDNIQTDIREQINQLPSLERKDIIDSGLKGKTLREILNVIEVTNKFNEEFDHEANISNESNLLSEKITAIKNDLANEGLIVTDQITLPTYEGEEQFLNVTIPEEFRLVHLKLNDTTKKHTDGKKIKLDKYPEGPLSLEVKLKLNDPERHLDVFAPIEWTWAVSQEGMEEREEEGSNPGNGSNGPIEDENGDNGNDANIGDDENADNGEDNAKNENNKGENNKNNEENNQDDPEAGNINALSSTENELGEPDQTEDERADVEEGKEEETSPETPEKPEEPEPTETIESETITITNNYLVQKVLSSLVENPKDTLVKSAAAMVHDYYKLFSLYELYFGLDMSEENLSETIEGTLGDSAAESSLYFFIHEKKIKDILEEHILNNVTENVTSDIQNSMSILEENITRYVRLVEGTSNQSTSLVETIVQTKNNANILNEELAATLEEIAKWRETSQQLIEEKTVVLDHDQEVNSAVMNLDTNYQPLLLASESLAEQARGSFDVANNVYETFEAIDQQAVNIQESGTNIVSNATDLANKFTEKALADEVFAENFNEVLANSRVGDRPNENLYSFLANPVETKNTGVITKGESFTAYFIVIILSIITLFTAYVMSTLNVRRKGQDVFEADHSIIDSNKSITLITTIVGVVEGLAIGLVSFYLLQVPFEKMYSWLAVILLFTVVMLFFATYLLRQLKMVGMFILLALLSLYLLLTRALGFAFEKSSVVESLRTISPLQYVESLLSNMTEADINPSIFTYIVLFIFGAIGLMLNLFVYRKNMEEVGEADERQVEAN